MKAPQVFRLIVVTLLLGNSLNARQTQIQTPEETEYGDRFFDQLRSIFGRFRESDLSRVFQMAEPIKCSELVSGRGEWQEVAFFNEDRDLGGWYRSSLREVQESLTLFWFKGRCVGERAPIQLSTRFAVKESLAAYDSRKIRFDQVAVKINPAVGAVFDPRTQAYTFDFPYLFLVDGKVGEGTYSLEPLHATDRYAKEVTNHWDCKSVRADDVTYRFLICRTTVVDRSPLSSSRLGSSAYSILSDGKEASSTVKLSYGIDVEKAAPAPKATEAPAPAASPRQARLSDIGQRQFRLRFNTQTWRGRIDTPQLLAGGSLLDLPSSPPLDREHCVWTPGPPALAVHLLEKTADADVIYSLAFRKDLQSVTSVVFETESISGSSLGTLQCYFPQDDTPAGLTLDRWQTIVGNHVAIETPDR